MHNVSMNIVGVVHSPFKQKFGIPRQPALASSIAGKIEILPPYDRDEAFRDLDTFSHLWISFVFHAIEKRDWQPMVRPPRLGGNKKVGVFASRSTHRPNPLGLSVVTFEKLVRDNDKLYLHISGHDLLDQTPVVDIKPYLPYSDNVSSASNGYASVTDIERYEVTFSKESAAKIKQWSDDNNTDLKTQLIELLSQDPRPAYNKSNPEPQRGGMRFYDLNVSFSIENKCVNVVNIQEI